MGKRVDVDDNTKEIMISMYNEGKTFREIERRIDGKVQYNSIKGFLIRWGVCSDINYEPYGQAGWNDILELYKNNNWDEIHIKYPDLKRGKVHQMSSLLGVSNKEYHWTDEEVAYLTINYNVLSLNEIYEHFNHRHSEKSISTKAKKIGLTQPRFWSDEENEILINNYSHVSKEEMAKLLPNRTPEAISSHAKELGVKSFHYLNEKYSEEQRQFIIDNWKVMSDDEIAKILGKTPCGVRDQRAKLGLYKINKEYAKYENLSKLFRGHIQEWKTKSMETCDYKCIFTGSKDFAIHHLYGFNKILEEAFREIEQTIELVSDNPTDYTKEQLDFMIDIFKKIHDKYPLGVCTRKDIHDLFHVIYGSGGNTPEQWQAFSTDLMNGKYNDRITL